MYIGTYVVASYETCIMDTSCANQQLNANENPYEKAMKFS